MASKHNHHNRKYNKKSSEKKISKKLLYLKDKKKQPKLPTLDLMAVYVRIYLSKEQIDYCYRTGGTCRFVYNQLVNDYYTDKDKFEEEQKNKKKEEKEFFSYDLKKVGKIVTGLRHDEDHNFVSESHSKFLQQAARDFSTAVTNHHKYWEVFKEPSYKKKYRNGYSFRIPIDAVPGGQTKTGINCVKGNRISLCSKLQNVLFDCSKRDMSWLNKHQKEIRSITVKIDPDGKQYASILLTAQPLTVEQLDTIFGFDLGLKELIIGHYGKINIDADGFVSETDDDVQYIHVDTPKNYIEPNHKEKEYERHGITRFEHYTKKLKHKQKLLSRKEYNREEHMTLRNKDAKKSKFNKEEYRKQHKEENFQKYLDKRAKTKPFKHPKREKKKGSSEKNPNANVKEWHRSSRRYEKARVEKAKIDKKLANIRKDVHQKTTTEIVRNSQMIVSEDIKVSNLMKNHHVAKAYADAGWSAFINILTYKAVRYGRTYLKINTFFPSTKLCHKCGYKNNNLTLEDREWDCPECGEHHLRDENAGDNITSEGVREFNRLLAELLHPSENQDSIIKLATAEFAETERGDALCENQTRSDTTGIGVSNKTPMKR